jgi:hypothetical protein
MQCPQGDGELLNHTAQGEHNLTISYSTCPVCHGYWMESFAANFIKLPPDERKGAKLVHPPGVQFSCPVCTKQLTRSTGENIPDAVTVYSCPDNHGYFFPTGQLFAFKEAQKAKIAYHKIWHIPLVSVASVLLAGLLVLVFSFQGRQTTTSQAQQILTSKNVFVSPATHGILVNAVTSVDATITLSIPEFQNYSTPMLTKDKRAHQLFVSNIPPGTYAYSFTITASGVTTQSEVSLFVMPE